MTTLDELAAKVESLRAEIAAMREQTPHLTVQCQNKTPCKIIPFSLCPECGGEISGPKKTADPVPSNPKCPMCGGEMEPHCTIKETP